MDYQATTTTCNVDNVIYVPQHSSSAPNATDTKYHSYTTAAPPLSNVNAYTEGEIPRQKHLQYYPDRSNYECQLMGTSGPGPPGTFYHPSPYQELLVPTGQSSGSSEASDDSAIQANSGLYHHYQPDQRMLPGVHVPEIVPRCDSSRSDGTETSSSSSEPSSLDDGSVLRVVYPQQPSYQPPPPLPPPPPTYIRLSANRGGSGSGVGGGGGVKFVKNAEDSNGLQRTLCKDAAGNVFFMPTDRMKTTSVVANQHLNGANVVPAPHAVPTGWKRLLVDNTIIYLTPSNVALSSMEQVKVYLQTTGTCKCGLECPVHCDTLFNFNPKIPSRPWTLSDSEMTKLCNHSRKPLDANALVPQVPAVNMFERDGIPTKRKKKKHSTYPGVSVSQLLAQRERAMAGVASNIPQQSLQLQWQGQSPIGGSGGGGSSSDSLDNNALPPAHPIRLQVPTDVPPDQAQMPPTILHQQQTTQEFLPSRPSADNSNFPIFPSSTVLRPRSIPPWHQTTVRQMPRKPPDLPQQQNPCFDRVPSLQRHLPLPGPYLADHEQTPLMRKRHKVKKSRPTFMDDPNGYLAQQTALLHNTIARPNFTNGVPLPSNMILSQGKPITYTPRSNRIAQSQSDAQMASLNDQLNNHSSPNSHNHNHHTSAHPCDSCVYRTVPTHEMAPVSLPIGQNMPVSDPRPIQGGTISTSNGSPQPNDTSSPVCSVPAQSPGNLLISSSLMDTQPVTTSQEDRSGLLLTTVSSSTTAATSATSSSPAVAKKSSLEMVPNTSIQTSTSTNPIIVSSNGQYLKLNQQQPLGTVLVNTLPGPFVLQPGMMTVDTMGTMVAGNVVVDDQLASPDRIKFKKSKKRKSVGLASPAGVVQMSSPNNMIVNQPFGGMQAVTIVPGKPVMMNNQINLLQPVVQNFPTFQQFLVPGLGNMVMAADGTTTLLQDTNIGVQLQPAVLANTGFITATPASTAMLIRSPNSSLASPEYIQLVPQQTSPAVSSAAASPATVAVQQNTTTIVRQETTMVAAAAADGTSTARNNGKELELQIVAADGVGVGGQCTSVSTQTQMVTNLSKEPSQDTFCQTVGSPPDTTTGSPSCSSVLNDHQMNLHSIVIADDALVSSSQDDGAGGMVLRDVGCTTVDDSAVSSHSDSGLQDGHIESHSVLSNSYVNASSAGSPILNEGDLVWGPVKGHPAWPGQIVGPTDAETGCVLVKWFGSYAAASRVPVSALKTLSEGLDAVHRNLVDDSTSSRRCRKLGNKLEEAIQEAMSKLDKMSKKKKGVRKKAA